MVKNIARHVALAGVFIIPLLPFLVTTSMYFPYITGKNFAFRIIVELMLCAYALLAVAVPAYRPRRSWVFVAMGVFTVVVGLADMLGVAPLRSFWSNYERMEGFIAILHLAAYLLVVGSIMKAEKLWERLFNLSVLASMGVCVYAFSEIATSSTRADATLGNATYLAVYLLFNMFLALLMAYRNRGNRLLAVGYLVAIAAQFIAMYATQTRGTILGLIGGLGLAALIIAVRGRSYPRLRRVSLVGIGGIIVCVAVFLSVRNAGFVQQSPTLARIANISLQETTVQSRFLLWTRIGWNGFKERPILGWGQDNFIVVFGKYYDPLMYKQEPWFDRAHNVFMDWLIAGGALGLLSYLLLFGAGLYVLARSTLPLPEKAIFTGLFAAYFFHNIFVFDNLISYIYFVTLLGYIHARSMNVIEASAISARDESSEGLPIVTVGVVVIAAALVYFVNVPYIARSQTLIDALTLDYRNQYDSIDTAYAKALAKGGLGLEETKEQLVQSTVRIWTSDAPQELKEALVIRARKELEESIDRDPGNTRPLFFLAYLLTKTGSPEEGIAIYRQALEINPARQNFIYEIARTYLAEGRFKDVIATFKEAYEKAPENDQALGYYAAALIYDGQIEEGEQVLLDRFGTTTVDNPVLLDAYAKHGKTKQVINILEVRLADMAPADDPQTRLSLALAYLDMGDREAAIEQLQRAIVLSPNFAAQGNQMIEAIKAGRGIKVK
jgi:O-antigen ligase/Tfp pilus assembly protein PilF